MNKDELQYLSDTAVIELLASDLPMTKQAGLFDQLGFNSVASSIKQFVAENIREDVPGRYAGSVINLLTPGIMWKIHPILGAAAAVAHSLGFNLTTIFSRIKSSLQGPLSEQGGISLGELDSLVKDAVGLSATSASLEPARELVSTAQWRRRPYYGGHKPQIPFGHQKGAPLLMRVFGNLGKMRGRVLVAGIIVWFLKTLLLSSGLVLGAGALTSLFTGKDKERPTEVTQESAPGAGYQQKPTTQYQVQPTSSLEASGRGEKYFPNDKANLWIVPLINKSINNTLLTWAIDVYPQLAKHEEELLNSSKFNQTVQTLKRNYNRKRPDSLIMPQEFHSRKQVVDTFAEDVAKQIGK